MPGSAPKWTPGPWTVRQSRDGRTNGYIRCARRAEWAKDGLGVARAFTSGFSLDEARANARLIAAAPSMFEALTMMVEAMRVDGLATNRTVLAVEEARAALAKAEGR